MHPIVWFDVRADDIERAQKFYGKLFGWKFKKYPGMDYWHIRLGGKDGLANGGLGQRRRRRTGYLNFIGVPSVARFVAKVERLGGKVLTPKTVVPGRGCFAVCRDTEDNVFALWETAEKTK